jgi:putative methanogenesis marker protein 12
MDFSTLGIDHGTQAVRFCVLPEETYFEIPREGPPESVISVIEEAVPLERLELVGVTYAMGDGINRITDIRRVKNRGVLPGKAGEPVGTGTRVYDEIASSGLRAVVIPGLHRGIEALDPRFRALYSHCASAEKVSLCYDAYLTTGAQDLIVTDVSSNTVTIGIKGGRFLGAVDACLGAPGLVHGPLDLESLRMIEEGQTSANMAFSRAGVAKIAGHRELDRLLNPRDERDRLAVESLVMGVSMEVYGFLSLLKPEVVAVSGWAGVSPAVYEGIRSSLEEVAQVVRLDGHAAARGSAEIARDVLAGRRNFLGVEVDF